MQLIESSSTERFSFDARLLLHEYSHRINNEFASAIGMISVAAEHLGNDDAKATLAAVRDQLHSYARVHHALQMPEYGSRVDAAAYLRQLCRAICRAKLDEKGIKLLLVERTFQMDSERCWLLGLTLFELITNAARHAFDGKPGTISIELYPVGSFVVCTVRDNGGAPADRTKGRGLAMVQELAVGLRGTVDSQSGPNGTTTIVRFPYP